MHGCSSIVFVVCCVGGGLYDGLVTRVFVSNCVSFRNLKKRRTGSELGFCAGAGKKRMMRERNKEVLVVMGMIRYVKQLPESCPRLCGPDTCFAMLRALLKFHIKH